MQHDNEPTRYVYQFTNVATGIPYFGETTERGIQSHGNGAFKHLPRRHAEHLGSFLRGDHYNVAMQEAYDGGDTEWTFKVLEELPEGSTRLDARDLEAEYVRQAPRSYNMKHKRGSIRTGGYLTDAERAEIVELIKAGHKGKTISKLTGRSTGTISLIRSAHTRPGEIKPQRRADGEHIAKQVLANPVKRGDVINVAGTLRQLGLHPLNWTTYRVVCAILAHQQPKEV